VSWLVLGTLVLGCHGHGGDSGPPTDSDTVAVDTDDSDALHDTGMTVPSEGRVRWDTEIQPLIEASCAPCHVGKRFAYASLEREGDAFTDDESAANYRKFVDLLDLDAVAQSRLLAKIVPEDAPEHITHAPGPQVSVGDEVYTALADWAALEKSERCADCGTTADHGWLAYVEQPAIFWALDKNPIRSDRGFRSGARILLQPVDPATMTPEGEPVDFLAGTGFCGPDGQCDFGHLAADHAGTRLAFECRLSLDGADWLNDVSWNVCVAEIGADGRAQNPRFLMPDAFVHHGWTVARSTPFGLYSDVDAGFAVKGVYDMQFQTRKRNDQTPVFSPDDAWVYLSSRGPDPRSGVDASTTYHGFDLVSNIVAVNVATGERRTIYRNEGGEADFPLFRHNGNVAFHTWNLDRMDRHMMVQATADGMMELPVLFGATQGPNQWGKAVELGNGLLFGITGRRRADVSTFVPYVADHTLGTGLDGLETYRILDPDVHAQISEYGFCYEPPYGANCRIDRFWEDAAYSPDGRAFVAYSPDAVTSQTGEGLWLNYAVGDNVADAQASLAPWLPTSLGIGIVDHHGAVDVFLPPPAGKILRYPTWVGQRAHERVQGWQTDESASSAELHVADARLWLGFQFAEGSTDERTLVGYLDQIVALRVLRKVIEDNGGLSDGRPYRYAVRSGHHDHPTHLGINNATGFVRYAVPESAGGDAFGDVPLKADGSVRLTVPAGELLLFQGIDAAGHVVVQHSRVFTLPPGEVIETSVKRDQYRAQCSSCHASIDDQGYVPVAEMGSLPAGMDFDTLAAASPPADLLAATEHPMTFHDALRPILDAKCVSCHSGSSPAGDLFLGSSYSSTANYPPASQEWRADPAYLATVPADRQVRGYDWSVTYDYVLRDDDTVEYRGSPEFASKIAAYEPLGPLSPWDPGYQALYVDDGSRFTYLSGYYDPNFGRGARMGGNARDSFLLEVLGAGDLDPTRDPGGGMDHTGLLTDEELRTFAAVIDLGFPYMASCAEATIPSGPNAGQPWCDPIVTTP
jgi:hypothetical protein